MQDQTDASMVGTLRTLETPRLLLRPWRDDDREPFAAMSSDQDVMRYLLPFASPGAVTAWIERQMSHLRQHGFCFWALESKQTGEFVGATGLHRLSYDAHFTPAVEVGWRLARKHWGHGYAVEAATKALQFGFEYLGLLEIVANTAPANVNSQKVMTRLGMTHEPRDDFDHPLVPKGNPLRTQVLYRMSRGAWLTRAGWSEANNSPGGAGEGNRTLV
ncbi:putative enzyme [Burkholderiales bacterium 8X]|nr:putative enzyme [Burkholderiales bacterium 8X]